MLRRLVFALLLVCAAFAGGAAINGPGLAWLQRNFAGGSSIIVDGGSGPTPAAKAPPRQFPTAQAPPLQVDFPRAAGAARKAGQDSAPSPAALARADAPLLPESASDLAPLPRPAPAEESGPTPPAFALTGPRPAPGPSTAPGPASLPPLDPGPVTKADPVARLASVETPTSTSPPSSSKAWPELRARMRALGVVRYALEGEVDGRVRFSCVIPVDGLKAVGHHFEAEGDDEIQAVEATLGRIALWKATAPD